MAILLIASGTMASCPGQTTRPTTTTTPTTQPDIEAPGLAGSFSCRGCHEPFYEKWATSHHGLAMQPFTGDFAMKQLKPLPEPIPIREHRYRVELGEAKNAVVENGPDGERKYALVHALGGKNVFYFLTPLERGRLQVLPVCV